MRFKFGPAATHEPNRRMAKTKLLIEDETAIREMIESAAAH
jgi:hypothetical protein